MPYIFGWNLITMPTSPSSPQSVEYLAVDPVALGMSPFTGQQQTQDWQASWREASITMPPLTHKQAQNWIAFLLACRGQKCVFQFGDPFAIAPIGTALGSPSVSVAGQTGFSLVTHGWAANQANLLLPGDQFQIGYRLYRITDAASSDGSGIATLNFSPNLRESPGAGDGLAIFNTQGLWRLKSNTRKWSLTLARTYGIQFDIREAL